MAAVLPFQARPQRHRPAPTDSAEVIALPTAPDRSGTLQRAMWVTDLVTQHYTVISPQRFVRLQQHLTDITNLFSPNTPEVA